MATRKTATEKAAPAKRARKATATGSRKGATRRVSYTLRAQGKTLLTTPFKHVAEHVAVMMFGELRSVSMIANHEGGKSVQLWIYGRAQK